MTRNLSRLWMGVTLVLSLSAPAAAGESDLWVRQMVFGMDCAPCAYGVERRVGRMDGVASIEVSLENGIAEIRLIPGAAPDLNAIRSAISEGGFTPRDAEVRLRGRLIADPNGGDHWLQVGDRRYGLIAEAQDQTAEIRSRDGQRVVVTGRVPEAESGSIRLTRLAPEA